MTVPAVTVAAARRLVLNRRVRLLVAATIGYNVVEAIVAIAAGTIAGSATLVGFGLDTVVEVASAAGVAWLFAGRDPEVRERTALRVIAWSFFGLAAYVTVRSVPALTGAEQARHSTVGLILAAVSLAVMPVLSCAQRRTGRPPWRLRRAGTPCVATVAARRQPTACSRPSLARHSIRVACGRTIVCRSFPSRSVRSWPMPPSPSPMRTQLGRSCRAVRCPFSCADGGSCSGGLNTCWS